MQTPPDFNVIDVRHPFRHSWGDEMAADIKDAALLALLQHLKNHDYQFVTTTPATHRTVLRRSEGRTARTLRDLFGWSLPFSREAFPSDLMEIMAEADIIETTGEVLKSRVRVSSIGKDLFLHSAFPPSSPDAIFFGPDTYRFAAFLRQALDGASSVGVLVDVGSGSGAGAIAARRLVRAERTILTDINPAALRIAAINAKSAGVSVELRRTSGVEGVEAADLIVANPPFIAGGGDRTYRDGGDMHGMQTPLAWVLDSAKALTPRGQILIYTGSPVIDGRDPFLAAVRSRLDKEEFEISCQELDPDIFGGELRREAYKEVERIAAIGLTVRKRR